MVKSMRRKKMAGTAETLRPKTTSLIRLRDVVKVYESIAGGVAALRGISLDVRQGDFVAIVGKSGAGKSTLVNMITGVDDLTSGEVWIDGVPVHDLGENELALWRGRTIGVVYQTFELLPQLSLLDNVLLPMDLCGMYRGRRSIARAQRLLEQVGLEAHMYKPPTRISGGQKQRVAIARALANDPPIIVADEPTGNLDSATADEIHGLFAELIADGKTIVMVTHDEVLARRATRTLVIQDGGLTPRPHAVSARRARALPAGMGMVRVPAAAGGYDD
ncbi:MAG: ABC transporter ATP-binding protein [Anaerolineae bacterium]|nr:ABC transporter ATP-binding protein [Anaerolineae bacterium]